MIVLRSVLDEATQALNHLAVPRLEAEILLSFVLNKPRAFLYTHPEYVLSSVHHTALHKVIQRRLQGEPLAYITGEKEFWSLRLSVNPDVLIPRAETELLVEKCLELLSKQENLTVADLGTGSGAIALAVACERPNWDIIATDHSHTVLAVAKRNAQSIGIKNVEFYQGNWCAALPNKKFAAILSNPPYIDEHDPALELSVKNYEPKDALISAEQGLADLQKIATQAGNFLQPNGWLLLEHGYQQGELVNSLLKKLGYQTVHTFNDLQNLPRVTVGCCSL